MKRINKSVLRERLEKRLGVEVSRYRFSEFMAAYCERTGQPELILAKTLTMAQTQHFSRWAGYDLTTDA